MIRFVPAIGLVVLMLSGCNASSGGGASVAGNPSGPTLGGAPQNPLTLAQTDSDVAEFAFQNDTAWGAVTELYVAAESQQGWGPELLGAQGGPIPEGTTRTILIDDGREDCLYEVFYRQAGDPSGSIQNRVDMCADNVVVLGSAACSPDFCGDARGTP